MKAPRDLVTTAHSVTSLKNRIMTNAIRTSDLVQFMFMYRIRDSAPHTARCAIRQNTDCTKLSFSVTVQEEMQFHVTQVRPSLRQCIGNSQNRNTKTCRPGGPNFAQIGQRTYELRVAVHRCP